MSGRALANERVILQRLPQIKYSSIDHLDVEWYWQKGKTDGQGRLKFARVAPGSYSCARVDEDNYLVVPSAGVKVLSG